MKKEIYKDVERSESGWWYRGRHMALQSILGRYTQEKGAVLDVGAGYGAMFTFLSKYGVVSAYEVYPDCIAACVKRGYRTVLSSKVELAQSLEQFSLVGAFDVIEHVENDTEIMLAIQKLLSPGGLFVATVPAHQFLFGKYDVDAHHFRRYSKKSLMKLLQGAGFEVVYLGYWNFLLFFPAALLRVVGLGGTSALTPNLFLDRIFGLLVYFESLLLRVTSLPIGMSLVVVARVKTSEYSSLTT